MSKQVKKPAELSARKIKNSELLPHIFNTDPNNKMLDSTLDVMTSKGQLQNFKETYGIRSATNKLEEFFKVEEDQVRRESQSNNMLVLNDTDNNYLGKVSYLDIENYFRVKGLELEDGVQLDKNINILDLPINSLRLTDYNLFYWIANDLPAMRFHFHAKSNGTPKLSIKTNLFNKPFATLKDDITGKEVALQTGMVVYFTGTLPDTDSAYLTTDIDAAKTYFVYGDGEGIQLLSTSAADKRIPDSWLKKRLWDKTSALIDSPAIKWDSEVWDGSQIVTSEMEYITIEKYTANENHWQIIDHWYHINLINTVADFIGENVEAIVSSASKAKRPIITFNKGIQLCNWPNNVRANVKSLLIGDESTYTGSTNIVDEYGYKLVNDDYVVFSDTNGIYTVFDIENGAKFIKTTTNIEGDGALIITDNAVLYNKLIYKNSKWQFAQNKKSKNQAPLFEFYFSNGNKLTDLYGIDFKGGKILDFAPGLIYDEVLSRNIEISSIDFDIINENNSLNVSPNQIKFITDVDRTFKYFDIVDGISKEVNGPYGYYASYGTKLISFYQPRRGLDLTRQTQDLLYETDLDSQWTSEIIPTTKGFDTLHIFYDNVENLKFYFNVVGHGLIKFSSKSAGYLFEQLMPLISGSKVKIVCHDLPYPLTFYKPVMIDNLSRIQQLSAPYCTNNGISNGVIELDLSPSIYINDGYIDNELNIDNTRLYWIFNNVFKSAVVRPVNKWRFLQFAYLRDKTNPIYEGYDYTINDLTLYDGGLAYNQSLTATSGLNKKADAGDKICIDSILEKSVSKTAPLSLTTNPLNKELDVINYYSLYQHATNIKSNSTNIKEYTDPESVLLTSPLGGGTFLKHSDPSARAIVMATNLPFDFTELLIKQGKHYDLFLDKLTKQFDIVIASRDYTKFDSLQMINFALKNIYLNQKNNENFWYHSNMVGWGSAVTDYTEQKITVTSSSVNITPIDLQAGKETLLHILYQGKLLTRNKDYALVSNAIGYYTDIEFNSDYISHEIIIRSWNNEFSSKIPASLAKIGLSPLYMPEIYLDASYPTEEYFLIRHDGTKLRLEYGVNENKYPIGIREALLYEYEKAVWSSIAYEIENNNNIELYENQPGYFRGGRYPWTMARETVASDTLTWLTENKIFVMQNTSYDGIDPFTHIYLLGSNDDKTTVRGSWRVFYKWIYDTDRPHTHPWEMLGYTVKPSWWDTHYSWTDSVKRIALESALRTGNIAEPPNKIVRPYFARVNNVDDPEIFPVDTIGNLLPPSSLPWLADILMLDETINWVAGDMGPYEQVFANTQRGLAAEVKYRFLLSPIQYVNLNWLPGQTKVNEWGLKLDKTSNLWQKGVIEHNYHRQIVNNNIIYTAGIESLFGEFCALTNKDFKTTVIDKFSNLKVNKEFLLSGFTSKNNVRIESTSISSQRKSLFVPEENYQVRLVKHYSDRELFFSAIRIIWTGSAYSFHGFTNELGVFNYNIPTINSPTLARTIGDAVMREKTKYTSNIGTITYGEEFVNKQDVYDIIIGYGKYLASLGFKFEEPEGGDIRDWQLSAKQFVFWSNDMLAPGNYIDLNPAADAIILDLPGSQLENLEGTNENIGQCVDRLGNPLFSKDLLVQRSNPLIIKTKNTSNPVYGIKMTFSYYESVVHLDSTSIFDDVYFLPEQSTTKRSFVLGGKKSQDWDGKYNVPGYVVNNNTIIPNYDTMSELGRNLLDVENVLENSTVLEASRAQFGLNRNPELRQLFLQEENEVLFKNAITFNKGTSQVFTGLEPLTHDSTSKTQPLEEYMVRTGELGNTKNIEYYEFELVTSDLIKNPQIINFVGKDDDTSDQYIHYIKNNSPKWVHHPYGKTLSFNLQQDTNTKLKDSPILIGDTDFVINTLDELPNLYDQLADIWDIPSYDETTSYKQYDRVRYKGDLYFALTTISTNTWDNNQDKFTRIEEPFLPNIYVNNYYKPNPNLTSTGDSIFTPGTWQVMQTIDGNLNVNSLPIDETCPGPTDISKARITTTSPHYLQVGDYVLIVNADDNVSSANGIWKVTALGNGIDSATQFYIDTRITSTMKTGKIFTFKPVRFKNMNELIAANTNISKGYKWKKKFNPLTNILGTTNIVNPNTPSGYDPVYPIAIVDDSTPNDQVHVTYDYGNYKVFQVSPNPADRPSTPVILTPKKSESLPVDPSDIEHLIIYDYKQNKTLAKIELFDPRKMYFPKAFKDDIDVISRVDPAKYTKTTDEYKAVYSSLGWREEYVGRRWWDTSTIQFSDYENGDDETRAKYWGTTINNALPDIYEWTKSTVHPSQWESSVMTGETIFGQVASGSVYIDNTLNITNYHWVEETDYTNGNTYTVYYFWVKNKDSISIESTAARTYSTKQLSKVILNPSSAGLAWWAPISSNGIIIKGIAPYLTSDGTVVQIKKKTKGEEKHQQWIFVSENNSAQTIPEWVHRRFRDSISGFIDYKVRANYTIYDPAVTYHQSNIILHANNFYICRFITNGTFNSAAWQIIINVTYIDENTFEFDVSKNVPDVSRLHKYSLTGNQIRPYAQTWFTNTIEARRNFIKKINKLLINVDITSLQNWNRRLDQTNYFIFGDYVDMTEYWTLTDYNSADFDQYKEITSTVQYVSDIYTSALNEGEYIRVLEEDSIYKKTSNGGWNVVYRAANQTQKRGAIKFKDSLYDEFGWDSHTWDTALVPWDHNLNSIFYIIVEALRNDIFVDEYHTDYAKTICAMFRYVLSEQVTVDWLQKSSTIEPLNLIGQQLDRTTSLQRDKINVLINFYSSVKSYRDKIRSGTITKQLVENTNLSINEELIINIIQNINDIDTTMQFTYASGNVTAKIVGVNSNLIDNQNLKDVVFSGPGFNDMGKTIEESTNHLAVAVKNYVGI